jgi:hypothetical protein
LIAGTESSSTKSAALLLNNEPYVTGVTYSLTPALDPVSESALAFNPSNGVISYVPNLTIPPSSEHTLNAIVNGGIVAKEIIKIVNMGDQLDAETSRFKSILNIIQSAVVLRPNSAVEFTNVPEDTV